MLAKEQERTYQKRKENEIFWRDKEEARIGVSDWAGHGEKGKGGNVGRTPDTKDHLKTIWNSTTAEAP